MPDGGGAAVEVALGDGRRVRMRGKADRVDRRADGDLVVIDYKTGVRPHVRALDHDDPGTAGTHLQLPVYAYAARAAYGGARHRVEAYYWFVGRGRNQRFGYDVDDAVDEVFSATPAHDRRRHRSAGCSRLADRARAHAVRRLRLLRSRRDGHHRPLARVGAQVRRARARGVP